MESTQGGFTVNRTVSLEELAEQDRARALAEGRRNSRTIQRHVILVGRPAPGHKVKRRRNK